MKSIIFICIFASFACTKLQDIKPKYPKEGLWYSDKQGTIGINALNYHFYIKENNLLTVEIDNNSNRKYYFGKWKYEKDTVRMGWYFDDKQSSDSAFFYYNTTKATNSENPSPANGYIHANNPYNLNTAKTKSANRTFIKHWN